jgi:hypothetical protein
LPIAATGPAGQRSAFERSIAAALCRQGRLRVGANDDEARITLNRGARPWIDLGSAHAVVTFDETLIDLPRFGKRGLGRCGLQIEGA